MHALCRWPVWTLKKCSRFRHRDCHSHHHHHQIVSNDDTAQTRTSSGAPTHRWESSCLVSPIHRSHTMPSSANSTSPSASQNLQTAHFAFQHRCCHSAHIHSHLLFRCSASRCAQGPLQQLVSTRSVCIDSTGPSVAVQSQLAVAERCDLRLPFHHISVAFAASRS